MSKSLKAVVSPSKKVVHWVDPNNPYKTLCGHSVDGWDLVDQKATCTQCIGRLRFMARKKKSRSNSKVVFDERVHKGLGQKVGSRFRDKATGRFVPNPEWFCHKSPTRAHHWIIEHSEGYCKYCGKVKEFPMERPDFRIKLKGTKPE